MAKAFWDWRSRPVAFWTLVAITFVLQLITTAITIRLCASALTETKIWSVSVAASVFDMCVLPALLIHLALCSRRPRDDWNIEGGFTAIALVAAVLTIITFAQSLHHSHYAKGLASAGIVFWTFSFMTQFGFFLVLSQPNAPAGEEPPSEPMAERQVSPRSFKRSSLSIHLAALTPTKPPFGRSTSATPSPKDSGFTLTPRSSIRDSLNQALRPMGSKTRLLMRNSFASADSPNVQPGRPSSFDIAHHHDGFENWDTSAVEDAPTSPCHAKAARSRLETIPGSRPVSPAKPLNGPFPDRTPSPRTLPAEETPLPDSASNTSRDSSETNSMPSFPLPPLRRPSTSQSHIHPLFRPESPIPPPIPSPGTVILASPFAGQVMTADEALSPRALSPTHGSLSVRSLSRPGSSRSLRLHATNMSEEQLPPLPMPLRKG